MKPKALRLTACLLFSLLLCHNSISQIIQPEKPLSDKSKPDSLFFVTLVGQYAESVNQADTLLASKIWARTADVTFLYPEGSEYFWKGVKSIYLMLKDNYITRKLSFNDLRFAYYGEVSWIQFCRVFDATLKNSSRPVQTKGRETQIWRKLNGEWRLVHVHYSGMPSTGEDRNF